MDCGARVKGGFNRKRLGSARGHPARQFAHGFACSPVLWCRLSCEAVKEGLSARSGGVEGVVALEIGT